MTGHDRVPQDGLRRTGVWWLRRWTTFDDGRFLIRVRPEDRGRCARVRQVVRFRVFRFGQRSCGGS